jgi:hypothetical protein
MTIDISALKEAEAAATSGPWAADRDLPVNRQPRVHSHDKVIAEFGNAERGAQDEWEANADLTALLRTHASELISAYEERDRLRAEIARVRKDALEEAARFLAENDFPGLAEDVRKLGEER